MFPFVFQGRDTPSPGDTPYLCRQRNSATNAANRQELNDIEKGALLKDSSNNAMVVQNNCLCPRELDSTQELCV